MSQEIENPKKGARISLEEGIAEWRSYLRRRPAIHSDDGVGAGAGGKEALVAVALAVAAAAAIKVPVLFGMRMQQDQELPEFYVRNLSLFVLPLLAAFFAWKRSLASVG